MAFNFTEWKQEQDTKRADRRLEIESAISRGLIVWQAGTFWSTAGCIYTRHGVRADATFIESAQSDPAYLAEHLENREYGFGFDTIILRTEVA